MARFYFCAFFCFAQRFFWASEIRLRAAALRRRLGERPAKVVVLWVPASNARARVRRAISASIAEIREEVSIDPLCIRL